MQSGAGVGVGVGGVGVGVGVGIGVEIVIATDVEEPVAVGVGMGVENGTFHSCTGAASAGALVAISREATKQISDDPQRRADERQSDCSINVNLCLKNANLFCTCFIHCVLLSVTY